MMAKASGVDREYTKLMDEAVQEIELSPLRRSKRGKTLGMLFLPSRSLGLRYTRLTEQCTALGVLASTAELGFGEPAIRASEELPSTSRLILGVISNL